MADTYFTVGTITSTHGIRGEVRVFPKTDFEEQRFKKGTKLYVRSDNLKNSSYIEVIVQTARKHKNLWLVSFLDLNTISDVEKWKGMDLCVPESDLMELPEGTYYFHQLIGLQVQTEEGTVVGDIVEVLTPGANDVYVVRGSLQKKDILLPAIPECIKSVNLESGVMIINLMPGLLDSDE